MKISVEVGNIESYDSEQLFFQRYTTGSEVRRSIILCHGLGGDNSSLDYFARSLLHQIPQAEIISYDQRGHGFSSGNFSKQALTVEIVLAKDLQVIRSLARSKKIILIGHSLGGITVQEYIRQKQECSQIILINSPFEITFPSQGRHYFYRLLTHNNKRSKIKRKPEDYRQFFHGFDFDPKRIISDARYTGVVEWALLLLSILGWKNKNLQNLNSAKFLFILGEKDLILPIKKQQYFIAQLPLAQSTTIPSNHISVIDIPEKIAKIAGSFID